MSEEAKKFAEWLDYIYEIRKLPQLALENLLNGNDFEVADGSTVAALLALIED